MDDVSQALELIGSTADNPLTIIGHSSGTHVLTMAFLQGQVKRLVFDRVIDQFLGLAGVYDIPSHYRFERSRGLQRISPMAAVCGYSLAGWRRSSPLILWNKSDPSYRQQMQRHFPRSTLLLHGSNDTVVPYVSTQIFAEATGLDWKLLYNVEHSEMILELMFGGATQHIAMEWIELHHGDRMRAK
jgi:acetyl esterase/lipase